MATLEQLKASGLRNSKTWNTYTRKIVAGLGEERGMNLDKMLSQGLAGDPGAVLELLALVATWKELQMNRRNDGWGYGASHHQWC